MITIEYERGRTMKETVPELGRQLQRVRELKGWSLKRVAKPAEMSTAYLQKLERGEVRSPSPHKLYALSQVLEIPYESLMRLAGYVVPTETKATASEGVNLLLHALNSEELSADEAEALARYLSWYRHDKTTSRG